MSAVGRRLVAGAAVVAALAAALVLVFGVPGSGGRDAPFVASGTVEATEARLGFEAAGRIAAVRVREGERVEAGDTLALLDREETLARREAMEADVEAARARLDEFRSGYRRQEVAQAQAALRAAEEQREDAGRDLRRATTLYEGGAVSEEALDKARTAFEVASSHLAEARERAEMMKEGPREEEVRAQRARSASATASLRALDAALDNMVVTAPFGGVVTVRHREPGEIVGPGSAVLTVQDTEDRWVRIYVPEDRIGALDHGQPATITTDTYPERTYRGAVRFIASEAEFTPSNVQTHEERVKLVYRVKVQITGDPGAELKPGVPADVRIPLEGVR